MALTQKLVCIGLLLMASCSPFGYTYINPLPDTAVYTDGGQVRATGTIGVLGAHAQVSTSPVKYVGITGGYFLGYKGFTCYNYAGQLYAPLFTTKKAGRFYMSLQFERAHGRHQRNFTDNAPFVNNSESRMEVDISYIATSITPSIYASFDVGKNDRVKVGVSFMFTEALYDKLRFKRSFFVNGQPSATGNKDINAPNTTFTGTGAWVFCAFESKKLPIFGYTNLGYAPFNYPTGDIQMWNLQSNYKFGMGFVNFTTFGLYLDWKRFRKNKAAN
ncbi:hypothetical protein QQ054_26555 [Oscillatoria amoena NRMC-F 0135]|nr:hypothetical protein [Oscillatoria amoena NRMC-F 0135]